MSHQIGQYFKVLAHKNQITGGKDELTAGQEAAHILAHTILGAAVAAAGGNDALAGALAAGGAEATAPILSQWLYGKNPADLTADEKATVSAIAGLTGAATGAAVGDSMADVAQGNQAGHVAVDNNTEFGDKIRSYIEDAKHYWHTEKEAKDNLDVIRNVAVNLIGDGLDSVVGLSDYGIDSLNAIVYCTCVTPNLCNQMQATLNPKNKAVLNSIKAAFDARIYIQFYELLDKAAHGDLQAREAAGGLLAGVLITKKVQLNVGKVSKAGKGAGKRTGSSNSPIKPGTNFAPDANPNLTVNMNQQNKHLVGTNEHKTANISASTPISTIDPSTNIQKLVNEYAGTGREIPTGRPLGMPGSKENISTNKVIGHFYDMKCSSLYLI